MHFLIVDSRFAVPIFVFLETDPNESGIHAVRGRWVDLDQSESAEIQARKPTAGFGDMAAIGGDPSRSDHFAIFATDGDVRAAGYALIEPRYLGPSWDTYLSVFHPEGGRRSAEMKARLRDLPAATKTRPTRHASRSGA